MSGNWLPSRSHYSMGEYIGESYAGWSLMSLSRGNQTGLSRWLYRIISDEPCPSGCHTDVYGLCWVISDQPIQGDQKKFQVSWRLQLMVTVLPVDQVDILRFDTFCQVKGLGPGDLFILNTSLKPMDKKDRKGAELGCPLSTNL